MTRPQVSVIIPCFNSERFLRETLESVAAQTVPINEVLVVDDGSTDSSARIARAFSSVVRVITQPTQGDCAARNRGLSEAKGEWVAFIDADDVWEHDKIERQLDAVAGRARVVCVHSGFYRFGELADCQRDVAPITDAVTAQRYDIEQLLLHPLINTTSAMVRADLPVRYPNWARCGGDMIYFAEVAQCGEIAYVPTPLSGYRMHGRQITREVDSWVQNLQARFRWIDETQERLGSERAAGLRRLLRQQVVEWIDLARWNRQWERYYGLQEYARTLDWERMPPAVLQERLLPTWVYGVKDAWDALTDRYPSPQETRSR